MSVRPPLPASALTLALSGQHLIEASAGTGKTWTLSALIVRFIVERQYATNQIIATTFTRAAAAELRGRVRERLSDVWVWLDQYNHDPVTMRQQLDAAPDLLLSYLIDTLDADQRGHAVNRLKAALPSFDQMFIGTLDSFCQKLLSEFAFDSGQSETLRISDEENALREQIMHDALRQWRSEQDPRLIDMMVMTGQLTAVADHQNSMGMVLNFPAAQLAEPAMPPIDFAALDHLMAQVLDLDLNAFDEFVGPETAAYAYLRKAGSLKKRGHLLKNFIDKVKRFGVQVLLALNEKDEEYAFLKDLSAPQKQFNKGGEQYAEALQQFDGTVLIQQIEQQREQLTEQLKQVNLCVQYRLSTAVREQLPTLLAERGETSFSAQMRMLANALDDGVDGETLAKQIRHRYPVALVDEFQDTNSDQDRVIARIWRSTAPQNTPEHTSHTSPHKTHQDASKGCLVLVGDPKQAIYGFRGGDVQTYLAARAHIRAVGHIYELSVNQRSVPALVKAVDVLFLREPKMGEGIDYPSVSAGQRAHPPLTDGQGDACLHNVAPLRWVALADQQDELSQIAWQISQLLAQAQRGDLRLGETAVQPEHIAVLGYSGRELDTVQALLQRAQIPVWRPSRVSVFVSPMAQDLAALMQVMLSPYHEQRLRRALSGPLVGWCLSQLGELDAQSTRLADLQAVFADAGQRWLRDGFLAAWQRVAESLSVLNVLAQHPDAERHLVNLRHLLELLHNRSERMAGPHHVLAWLMRQIADPSPRDTDLERRLPSQSGVQLMTIHGSKGLEFPIVFVTGLARHRMRHNDVLFYLNGTQRMISFEAQHSDIVKAHDDRIEAEQKRLTYVALTRAKHRLYLYVKTDLKKAKTNEYTAPLLHWIDPQHLSWVEQYPNIMRLEPAIAADPHWRYQTPQNTIELIARPLPRHQAKEWSMTSFSAMVRDLDHSRLSVAIDQKDYDQAATDDSSAWLDDATDLTADARDGTAVFDEPLTNAMADMAVLPQHVQTATQTQMPAQTSPQMPTQTSVPDNIPLDDGFDDALHDAELDIAPDSHAAPLWANLDDADWPDAPSIDDPVDPEFQDASHQNLDVGSDADVSIGADEDINLYFQQGDDSARFSLSGGTNSGECLHKILEYLDPTKPNLWEDTFSRQLQKHAVTSVQPAQLTPWFWHILHAPLPDGATLAGLGFRSRIREMEFHLSLPQGHIDQHALIERMRQDQISIPPLRHTQHVRYLKGAIDLVYQHGERFYVADYKSNRLGQQLDDYKQANMQHNMTESGYWLQAALYLVALHRYLRSRKADYRIEQHLGGACYLYLRGMRQDDATRGILHWQPDPQLILDLDQLLADQS